MKTKHINKHILEFVLSKKSISHADLCENLKMSASKANDTMKKLTMYKIIQSGFEPQGRFKKDTSLFRVLINGKDVAYLGIDMDTFDFAGMTLKTAVEHKINEKIGEKAKDMYAGIEQGDLILIPKDGCIARMKCGDLATGDILRCNGMEYRYNQTCVIFASPYGEIPLHKYTWKDNEEMHGWGVRMLGLPEKVFENENYSQPETCKPVLVHPLGIPIISMAGTYADFTKIKKVPFVPSTVKDITKMCYCCESLEETPTLSEGLKIADWAFANCKNNKKIFNIPNSLVRATCMFYSNSSLVEKPPVPVHIIEKDIFEKCVNLKGSGTEHTTKRKKRKKT